MVTVVLPIGNGVGGCGPAGGGMKHWCSPPETAAGSPPISTLGAPGGATIPGWAVGSVMRAAGGIEFSWRQLIFTSGAWMLHTPPAVMLMAPAAVRSSVPALVISTPAGVIVTMVEPTVTCIIVAANI